MLCIAYDDDVAGTGRQLDCNLWANSSGKLLRTGSVNRARRGILAGVLSTRFIAEIKVVALGNDRDDWFSLVRLVQ